MSHTNEERDMLVADIVTRDWRDRWRKLAAAIEDGTLAQVLWEQIQSQIPDGYVDRMDAAPAPPAPEAPELDWKSWSDVASILEDADASTELHPLRDAIEMGGPIIRALAEDRANECTAKHSAWESLGWAEKDRDEWRRRAEAAEAKLAAANEPPAAEAPEPECPHFTEEGEGHVSCELTRDGRGVYSCRETPEAHRADCPIRALASNARALQRERDEYRTQCNTMEDNAMREDGFVSDARAATRDAERRAQAAEAKLNRAEDQNMDHDAYIGAAEADFAKLEAKLAAANERLAAVGEWIGRWPMSHGEVAGVLRSEASRREGLMQVRGETGNVLDRLRRTADAIAAGPPPRPDAGGEA